MIGGTRARSTFGAVGLLLLGPLLRLEVRETLEHSRLRDDDEAHRTRFHRRVLLDERDVVGLFPQVFELHLGALRMRDLAAAEANGELHLVPGLDEAPRSANFGLEIVIVGLRPELDLLDLHDRLLAL